MAYLNKVMKNQFHHLTETQHNELLKLLQTFEAFLNWALDTKKTYPVDLKITEYMKLLCSRPYPVPKVQK